MLHPATIRANLRQAISASPAMAMAVLSSVCWVGVAFTVYGARTDVENMLPRFVGGIFGLFLLASGVLLFVATVWAASHQKASRPITVATLGFFLGIVLIAMANLDKGNFLGVFAGILASLILALVNARDFRAPKPQVETAAVRLRSLVPGELELALVKAGSRAPYDLEKDVVVKVEGRPCEKPRSDGTEPNRWAVGNTIRIRVSQVPGAPAWSGRAVPVSVILFGVPLIDQSVTVQ